MFRKIKLLLHSYESKEINLNDKHYFHSTAIHLFFVSIYLTISFSFPFIKLLISPMDFS